MELRPYQVEGVERILDRRNLLLAMVMGSGKTATAVTGVRRLRRLREVDHGLVFALKSTKWQWVREIARWDPHAKVQVVDGTKMQRVLALRRARRFHYTILHYECLVNDWDVIREYAPLDFLIFDEVTKLKGFTAKTSKRAKVLAKHSNVRLGLSGQPVENRPEELYSIMEAIDSEVLGSFHKFDKTFIDRDRWGKPRRYRNLPLIQQRLGSAMFRKSRDDIKEWLPDLIETEMPVPLDPATMKLHNRIKQDLSDAVDKALAGGATGGFDVLAHYGRTPHGQSISLMGDVMSRMLAMRMLSSHPRLLTISASEFDSELSRRGSQYASDLKKAGRLANLPSRHVKLDALLELVVEILAEDPRHKIVVFSYFKPMLAMIGVELRRLKIPHTTITGDIAGLERDRRIQRFNNDPACKVFLSSDAGAYGVDLNQGSDLIHYDLPWSAGALGQRSSRIDRTNSAFDQIRVTYMYASRTIEERMFLMLRQKAKVARGFIDGEYDAKTGGISLDLQSLRDFLDSP